jgi:hypothetical protein
VTAAVPGKFVVAITRATATLRTEVEKVMALRFSMPGWPRSHPAAMLATTKANIPMKARRCVAASISNRTTTISASTHRLSAALSESAGALQPVRERGKRLAQYESCEERQQLGEKQNHEHSEYVHAQDLTLCHQR